MVVYEEFKAIFGVLVTEKTLKEDRYEGSWLLNKDADNHSWILALLQRNDKLSIHTVKVHTRYDPYQTALPFPTGKIFKLTKMIEILRPLESNLI